MSNGRTSYLPHLAIALLLLAGTSQRTAAQRPAKTTVESQVMLAAEPGARFVVSAKGQHVAAVVLRGSRQVLVHDGVDGPRFDEILSISLNNTDKVRWSDDGARFIYFGRVGQEYVIIVDGKEAHRGPWSTELASQGQTPVRELGFTPRGKHWYASLTLPIPSRAHYQLVIDGKPNPVSHGFLEPVWSADGEHHAYMSTVFPLNAPRPGYELVVDGKVAPYNAGDPQFTTDGLHLFTKRAVPMTTTVEVLVDGKPYMRIPDGVQWHMAPSGSAVLGVASIAQGTTRTSFLLAGNKKIPGSECTDGAGLSGIYMSSDAKHFAAKCKTWVIADAKKGQEYADGVTNVAFTADGRAVYQAKTNGKSFVIVGDQESDAYDFILPETAKSRADQTTQNFAPPPAVIRGNKVGYIARASNTGNNFVVVVDGKKFPAISASALSLSPDGSRFAFLSGNGYQNMTVDGTAYTQWTVGTTLPGFQSPFQWSADSKHIAWLTAAPNIGVAIDGKFLAAAGMSVFARFTADSKHLVSMAWAPGPRTVISVDGEQVLDLPQNLELMNQADIYWSFPEDGTVIFVAQDGDQMKRFTITPGSGTNVETLLAKAK